MKDQVMFYLLILALAIGVYQAIRKKSERLFYALLLISFIQLTGFPLYLPVEVSLALWSFLGFIALFYKWKVKNIDRNLIVFSLMFLGFGIVFTLRALLELHVL